MRILEWRLQPFPSCLLRCACLPCSPNQVLQYLAGIMAQLAEIWARLQQTQVQTPPTWQGTIERIYEVVLKLSDGSSDHLAVLDLISKAVGTDKWVPGTEPALHGKVSTARGT